MRKLEVWLNDAPIGLVVEGRKGGRFSYEQSVTDAMPGLPMLSLCMPVKNRPFQEGKTANWFEGLLPEGARRDAICRHLGLSPYDWIGLLAEIGWECAGAVRVIEGSGDWGGKRDEAASLEHIGEKELADRLAALRNRQPAPSIGAYRMSLGGFQDKMCVAMPRLEESDPFTSAAAISLPCGGAPSTHILKPEPRAYPGLAESEAWAMTVAAHVARCSKVALLASPDAPETLVVERYDRHGVELPGDAMRIHQEDACQALGLPPSRKYASPNLKGDDPSYKGIADLLLRYSDSFEEEASELLRQIVVNLALGNWDAHAKNISFLYHHPGVPVLAPMYDVVPIAEVEPRTSALSLRIDGSLDPDAVSRMHVLDEAASWGFDLELAQRVYATCLEDIARGLEIAGRRYPGAAKRHEDNARRRLDKLA